MLRDDRLWAAYAGANLTFETSAGGRPRHRGCGRPAAVATLTPARREFWPVYASINHGRVLGTSGYDGIGEPWILVLSADLESGASGLLLAGDAAYFDNDLDLAAKDETGGDRGWVWVAKLEISF